MPFESLSLLGRHSELDVVLSASFSGAEGVGANLAAPLQSSRAYRRCGVHTLAVAAVSWAGGLVDGAAGHDASEAGLGRAVVHGDRLAHLSRLSKIRCWWLTLALVLMLASCV